MANLNPEAKQVLATTIRRLRERLLRDIRDEAERRYHLSVPTARAGLDDDHRRKRERIESWIDERVRSSGSQGGREQALTEAIKEAAVTQVVRLVLLRCLEVAGLSTPAVVTGGWDSSGYREFRDFAPELCEADDEGYEVLLGSLYAELAVDLPGLFGDSGVTALLRVPTGALREAVEQLNDEGLDCAFCDDTTLGWVYQFWNDPERRQIDASLDAQEKLRWKDIASKTQLFTERYMVEWLLQNSLGRTWCAICRRNGWPESELQASWQYYLRQEVAGETRAEAPRSIRDVRLLDPACGSGHFLVIAFDMFVRMYREEARQRCENWADDEIVESILSLNLHGVDIDPRAIQIAAAALYLKARMTATSARPRRMNLVAPSFRLADLAADDPSVVRLCRELERDAGIPEALARSLIEPFRGIDHLGSLLKVEAKVRDIVDSADRSSRGSPSGQGDLFGGSPSGVARVSPDEAKASALGRVEQFLGRHSSSDDLGLRLDGEQLASGIRFIRIMQEGRYDVVVGNPPYFGTQALSDPSYLDDNYPDSKENLCTAMLDRAMDLASSCGIIAFVTIRNWLYVSQLERLRARVFREFPPVCAADLGLGAFDTLPGVEVMLVVTERAAREPCRVAVANEPDMAARIDALAGHKGVFTTDPEVLARLPGCPFVYRWSPSYIQEYLSRPLLGETSPVRVGMKTSDNQRFLRRPWEISRADQLAACEPRSVLQRWVPYVKGAAGKAWIEPLSDVVDWADEGFAIRLALEDAYKAGPQGERHFFRPAVAFSTIGRSFLARAHHYPSIFDVAGSSVLPDDVAATVCLLNSRFAREIVEALNPTINFQVGDVARIPCRFDSEAGPIFQTLKASFAEHEKTDERSPQFEAPGRSTWRSAQAWAQASVDRPDGHPLPTYEPSGEEPGPERLLSFALGLALGRFVSGAAQGSHGSALSDGILLVSTETEACLEDPACRYLRSVWEEHRAALGEGRSLAEYLRKAFFAYHVALYENRPIYLPLSSAKKNFVALIAIHRWHADTLNVLLAEHLVPVERRLAGEIEDIRKDQGQRKAEKRLAEASKVLGELTEFIQEVTRIAEQGPPAPDDRTPKREVDARFALELNDGVLVNSAALWPLLEPHWKDPKKWWGQLASRKGAKGAHFDWSATARRYFPSRVEKECATDPVLAAAHRSTWRLHPQVAYEWELRLGRQVRAGFTLSEPGAAQYRDQFLRGHPAQVEEIKRRIESGRRKRERARKAVPLGEDDG